MTNKQADKLKPGDKVFVSIHIVGVPTAIKAKTINWSRNRFDSGTYMTMVSGDSFAVSEIHHTREDARKRICERLALRIENLQCELAKWSNPQ